MGEESAALHSGGCQCGAVRYALYAEPYGTHICHCRMCQKAVGGFFAALTLIRYKDFAWTRGQPATFLSSPKVRRGYCAACGTPLTFAYEGRDYIDLTVGSLDRPQEVKPEIQIGVESRMPWFAELAHLEEKRTEEALSPDHLKSAVSCQHPDRDTDNWPVRG